MADHRVEGLAALRAEIVTCARCPRLVSWREEAAERRPQRHLGERYWARPLPGFGDPGAPLLLVGLAPAAHGGNRTGRVFTGDRSGDFLFAALHRAGLANQATSVGVDDGLELRGAYLSGAVRCAPPQNRPLPAEQASCATFLARELELLDEVRVIIALGSLAFAALRRQPRLWDPAHGAARFAHGAEVPLSRSASASARTLLACYHPSQRNVFTGRLTAAMLDAVLARARELVSSR